MACNNCNQTVWQGEKKKVLLWESESLCIKKCLKNIKSFPQLRVWYVWLKLFSTCAITGVHRSWWNEETLIRTINAAATVYYFAKRLPTEMLCKIAQLIYTKKKQTNKKHPRQVSRKLLLYRPFHQSLTGIKQFQLYFDSSSTQSHWILRPRIWLSTLSDFDE